MLKVSQIDAVIWPVCSLSKKCSGMRIVYADSVLLTIRHHPRRHPRGGYLRLGLHLTESSWARNLILMP